MKKLKLLLAFCALLLIGGGNFASAQTDVTATYITNPSFELNGSTNVNEARTAPSNWNFSGDQDKYELHNSSSVTDNSFGPTNAAAGDYYYYMRRGWAGGSAKLSQTISSLPAGYYTFTAKIKTMYSGTATSSYYLSGNGVNASSTTFSVGSAGGFGSLVWSTKSVSFSLTEAKEDVEVALNINWVSGGSQIAIDDVQLTVDYFATSADYEALDLAIAAAEAKTLGFEVGEYAPYNNADALITLAAAKAVNRDVPQSQSTIQGYTSTLNGYSWTVNESRVNAFYRGDFGDYTPSDISGNSRAVAKGWSNTNTANCGVVGLAANEPAQGGSSNPGLAGLASKKALYLRGGFSTAYGGTTGYTVPLKADAIYTLSFKYGGWGMHSENAGTVTVKDGNATNVLSESVNTTGNANESTTAWQTFSKQIKTNDAGNYTLDLNFASTAQSAFSDFSLLFQNYMVKASATELPAGDMTADTWYYFDITTGGDYKLTASNDLSEITYVTDGTLAENTAGTTFSVDANSVANLSRVRYYVKSSSAQSLTVAIYAIATAEDYENLNAAINAAENNIGFEDGEYAPYNNKAMLTTLAEAKAINQSVDNPQTTVQGYTTALAAANWTANDGEVNAIRWNITDYTDDTDKQVPIGFTNGDGDAIRVSANYGSNTGLNQLDQKMCLNINTNDKAAIYGETAGYTLPLKANTVYELTFSYAGWGNTSGSPIIKILKEDDSELKSVTLDPTSIQGNSTANPWTSAIVVFQTTVAGNYKVSFGKSGNRTAFGDLELKKTSDVSVTVGSYGYATYVNKDYDLDFSSTSIEAYKVKVTSKGVATLTKVDQVPAGTPVLLYKEDGATEDIPVMTGAAAVTENDLVAGNSTTATEGVATIDGDYTNMILNVVDEKIGFYFANGQTVAEDRAYLHIATTLAPDAVGGSSTARMAMRFAGDITGVDNVEAATEKTVKDGKYLENGKIVIVKNGKKFNATGALIY